MSSYLRSLAALPLGAVISCGPVAAFAADDAGSTPRPVLEEIIVTSQKREQNVNDVGITIAAFDSKTIEELALRQPADVANATSNFSVNTLLTSVPNFTIRGVGVNDYAINQATSVGVYVDQVFLASPALLLFQMFDTARVEVLKGPQGTLYGRNTTGGAVLFISKGPTQTFAASTDIEIGNYGYYMVEGALSGPLSETLSARVAVNSTQSDGYQKNIVTGRTNGGLNRVAVRALFDWQPLEDFKARLNLHTGKDASNTLAYNTPGVGDNRHTRGSVASIDGVPYRDNDGEGASVTADWSLGAVVLTSVSSYDHLDRFEFADQDGDVNDARIDQILASDIKQVTQELRAASSGTGPFTWVGGLYYSKDEIQDSTIYPIAGAAFPPGAFGIPSAYPAVTSLGNLYEQTSTARAAFGQVEWDVAENWHLTGGLRYTRERKELDNVSTPWTANPGPGQIGPIQSGLLFTPSSYAKDFSAVSGKVGIDYRLSDDALLYASVSKGFKSGGFQGTLVFSPANIIPFDEETVLAYEAGAKLTLADGKVQLNAAAFYYDYENLQAQGTIAGGAGGATNLFALQNIGDATNIGLELDLQAAPTERLRLAFGVGYLDAKIVDPFIVEVKQDGRPAQSPKLNVNGRARYTLVETAAANWFVQGDFKYQSSTYFDIYETPFLEEQPYWLWNGSVGVESADEKWRASLWGRNLADEQYRAGGFTGGVAGPISLYGAPRTYGVSFSYNFQ